MSHIWTEEGEDETYGSDTIRDDVITLPPLIMTKALG